jgi:hypothetical protein
VPSVHLLPVEDTKAHWPASRRQTSRLTSPRHMARGQAGCADVPIRRRTDKPAWPRLGCRRKLRLLDLLEQHREGVVEDRTRIPVGDLAAEKRLQPPQLLVGFRADGEP